ncbi:unnamed protein product [Vitrella brassicaformis CCMP3155]|uniref:Phosphodiesterase n=3 Tax=Vitrella brassicaformis TaxID=1169539 RepID=A0A0G4EKM2_VITBC|nr:unnamed protein product [Vitrella brassicaformis CCMP3155]|eukprot:CEL97085.1 unnamed protein product [Vitrella brassicaformis CCMP3155]
MNGFVSPFLILGGILCLMGSAALATGRLGLGSRQITVVTCFSLQLVIMAALTLQASKPFPSLDTWMVPFFGELLMSLLAPGPALMLPFATANSLLLRVWPSAERDLTGDVLVIVGGLIAVYNAYVQDYTARQTFSYLPIEGTASLEFLDNPTDRSPTTVMRTALEMLLEKLSVLERRYERNSEVLSVVKYARTAVDKGAKTLFQLDLSSMCFSDSSSNEGQGKSDVRRYVEDLTSGQKPAARVVHSPGLMDRTLLGVGLQTGIEIQKLMASENVIGVWALDVFDLDVASRHHPLSTIVMGINQRYDMITHLGLDRRKFTRLVSKIESLYVPSNAYHNALHAADVTNSAFYFALAANWLELIQPLEMVAFVLACACHDVGHPGKNNAYMVSSQQALAVRYNDKSVLENYHAATTFEVMKEADCNALDRLQKDEYRTARLIVVEMILETDMKRHFEFVATFRAHFAKFLSSRSSTLLADDSPCRQGGRGPNDSGARAELLRNWEDRFQLYKMMLKCADLGHAGKPRELHEKWSRAIIEEFFKQGDCEKAEGLPVSPLCDRDTLVFEKSQVDFINCICIPMYTAFADVLDCPRIDQDVLRQARQNESYWQWSSLCQESKKFRVVSPKLETRTPRSQQSPSSSNPSSATNTPGTSRRTPAHGLESQLKMSKKEQDDQHNSILESIRKKAESHHKAQHGAGGGGGGGSLGLQSPNRSLRTSGRKSLPTLPEDSEEAMSQKSGASGDKEHGGKDHDDTPATRERVAGLQRFFAK